jgi:hypothetical protein
MNYIYLNILMDFDNVFNHSVKWYGKTAENRLFDLFQDNWRNQIHKDSRPNPLAKNKLRIYRTFKNSIKSEEYVSKYLTKSQRRSYAQFRFGVAPLRCEIDRYTSGHYIPYKERLCRFCDLKETENEMHVFCVCPIYRDIHDVLDKKVSMFEPDFREFSIYDKFHYMFSNANVWKETARAATSILDRRQYLMETNTVI